MRQLEVVSIPPDATHSVANDAASTVPLIWVSIGLSEPPSQD